METLVHSQPQPLTGAMPTENSSLSFAAGTKPHLYYKCLLTQYAQKLRKSPPVYHTRNEGFAHIPKYRSTVFFYGASFTSSNTFQHLKTAEMDVSRIAYFAIRQKSKTEALNLIRENKMFCKSIMADYADKINTEKPKYNTTQLAGLIPVFRSTMLFNGVNYQGDVCKSKKEAEQLVARAVILSYLDSESGNDMVEIVNCKFRQLVELTKVQVINSVHKGTNVVLPQPKPLIAAITPAVPVVTQPPVPEVPVQEVISTPVSVATQAPIPKVSVEAITPTVPVVTQPRVPEAPIQEVSTAVLVAAQTPIPKVFVEGISPTVSVVTQRSIPKVSIQEVSSADTVVSQFQTPIPEVSVEAITPAIPVVTQPPCPGLPFEPINPVVPVVTQPKIPKVEEYSEYLPVNQTSERKRSRRSRKKANKKMRPEAQMSGQPCS